MGGGRAVVTAAKVAGIQVAKGGFRFPGSAPTTEQFKVKNVAATASKSAAASISSVGNPSVEDEAMIMHPVWDDWEFAGIEDEPIPRVVFSTPPSLKEAKEATEDLKEAIDSVYQPEGVTVNNKVVETAVPQVALQAFAFLSENAAAQSVVASIASDPKVWDAVMENKDLLKFLNANNTSVVESDDDESNESGDCDLDLSEEKTKEFFEIFQDMKLKVIKLMENVSSYFGGLFSGLGSDKDTEDGKDNKQTFLNDPRTLFGLAVVVIFMVVLKRSD